MQYQRTPEKWGGVDKKVYKSAVQQARMMNDTDVLLWYEYGKAQSKQGREVSNFDKARNTIVDGEMKRRGLKEPKNIREAALIDNILTMRADPIYAEKYGQDVKKGIKSERGKQAYAAYLKLKKQGK